MESTDTQPGITIVYDGECPFCTRYTAMLRLRAAIGPVRLVDARSDDPVVARLIRDGFDLDEGMAMIQGDQVFHGDVCMNRLALMSTPSGVLNRLNAWIFRSPQLARWLYPVLRAGRNGTLRLLGRKKIGLSR